MGMFIYTAVNDDNGTVKGTVEASDRNAVLAELSKRGLKPVSLKEVDPAKKGLSIGALLGANRIKSDDLVMFTRQLSAMISAGVPLLRSINSLEEHADSKALKAVVSQISKDVESGMSLADSLGKHPNAFNDVYVNMVRAGESAGILDDILKRLAMQQEKSATMRKKIKSAMTYPVVLIVITIAAFFGLMVFVIPQIGKILKDLGGPDAKLPLLTEIMLGISGFLLSYWYILIPVFGGGVFLLTRFLKTPKGKALFHRLVLRLPMLSPIIKKVAVARFARTFSALMGAGVAVLEALHITANAVGNVVYEQSLIEAAEEVKNGKNLSAIIDKQPKLYPPIVAQMLAVGEETGQTDIVLVKVADFYEEEVDAAIDGISSIIEPIMILIMGSMVGLIAASVMGPIAGLAQNIKN